MAQGKTRKSSAGDIARRGVYTGNGRHDINKAKQLLRHLAGAQANDIQAKKALDKLGAVTRQRAEKERKDAGAKAG